MIRRSLRIGIRLGALGGMLFALYRVTQGRRPSSHLGNGAGAWAPARPSPAPATPAAATASPPQQRASSLAWVEPNGTECPPTHPIKAKLSSGLYHLPGMAAYGRTRPDRCYADEASAQADGLTKAKR